jgi:DNA polymerase (family X)
VGAGIAAVIGEFVLTGRSTLHDELTSATPLGLYDLLRIPGLGPKRIHTLWSRLGIDSLDALEAAARVGSVAALPGFGGKTEKKILQGIGFARSSRQLRRYPEALEIAVRLLEWLRARPEVDSAEFAGPVRRRMEVVDRIDLVAAGESPRAILEAFQAGHGGAMQRASSEQSTQSERSTLSERSRQRGATAAAALGERNASAAAGQAGEGEDLETVLLLTDQVTVRLRCVSPERFVSAMLWETGSDAHLTALAAVAEARGGRLERDGLWLDGEPIRLTREAEAYERLGLAYVPPELREGLGEVERAAGGTLPRLVELGDLRGTFHCHTTYSDGKATLAEMAAAARQHGWDYLGIADHSRTAAYAGGLPIERVREQHAEIDEMNRVAAADPSPFRLFKGIESDILPDGGLDYPDDVLSSFDYVVGSVHSSFGMSREEMTRRVVRAVEHPRLTILGHMTGRLLLTRDGYAIDVEEVLRAAAANGVVVEINANPHRLDLDWRHVRTAAELGILIAVNPDAHSVAALDHVAFGINMARKAGLEAGQILNTWTLDAVTEHFEKRRQAR